MLSNTIIKKTDKSDKKALLRFYKSVGYSAGYIGYDQCYQVVNHNGEIIAAAFASKGEHLCQQWLIHGVVVHQSYQNQGLASALIKHMQVYHHPLVCFATPTLHNFYHKLSFQIKPASLLTENHQKRLLAYQKKQPTLCCYYFDKSEETPL
ncbi:MAG: GNAT family N-acetyltransferase [Thalassotalea sp.]